MATDRVQAGRPSWLRELLVELSAVPNLAVPMKRLLRLHVLHGLQPQQLFEGLKLLMERGEVALQHLDGETALVLTGQVPSGAPPACGNLDRAELARLAALIGEACGCRTARVSPRQPSVEDRTRPAILARAAPGSIRVLRRQALEVGG